MNKANMKAKKAVCAKKKTSGGLITISQAAKFCDYSPAVLDNDARHKKLKTIKKGNSLMTTRQWLDQYLKQTEAYDNLTAVPKSDVSDTLVNDIAKELI